MINGADKKDKDCNIEPAIEGDMVEIHFLKYL